MEVFRQRYIEVRKSDDARNDLLNDLLQALDDVEKTIESNAFVLVLIDSDSLQFLNHLVRQGMNGGDEAAKLLRKSVFDYLKYDQHYKRDHKIVIRIYANLRGLSKTYVDKAILPNVAAFNDFVLGFNKAHPLCDFIDAGNHKEAVDTKLKETLNLYISNVHCKQIIFGAPTDNAYASFLNSYADFDVSARIRLLKGPPFCWEFQNILHKFQWTEFEKVFRDGLLSNDDPQDKSSADNTSLLDKPISDTANHATLLPWKLNNKNNGQRSTPQSNIAVGNTRPSSSDGSEARPRNIEGAVVRSNQNHNANNVTHTRPEDNEIVDALVRATRENLERTPRALDFGAVKSQVERLYNLRSDFWGSSDDWFSRSKNVIKWTVEEWILETNNPPPKNATWMLRYFSDNQSPSSVIRTALWRTKADKDRVRSVPSHEAIPSSRPPPTKPRADRSSELITTGPVLRNAAGQRIDLPIDQKPDDKVLNSIRFFNPRLCNAHHLKRACPNRVCKYDHHTRLTTEEFHALSYLARSQPCVFGTNCDNPNCTGGHTCPNGQQCTFGDRCRFASTHDMDNTIDTALQEENDRDSEPENTMAWNQDEFSQHEGIIW